MIEEEIWEREKQKCSKIERIKKDRNIFHISKKIDIAEIVNKINERKEQINTDYVHDEEKFYGTKPLDKDETLGLDGNSDKKLRTGKYKIDKKIDFHGKTLKEAFDLLFKIITDAYNKGQRCLLIITGKGKGSSTDRETIKSSMSSWLKFPQLASKIIKYTEATMADGGSGAMYILLKRNKNLENFEDDY